MPDHQGDHRHVDRGRQFGDDGKIGHDGDAGEEHAVFHREQAEQLRHRLAPTAIVKAPRNIAAMPSGRLILGERHLARRRAADWRRRRRERSATAAINKELGMLRTRSISRVR